MIWFNQSTVGFKYLAPEHPCVLTVKVMTADGALMLAFPSAKHLYEFSRWSRTGGNRKGVRRAWEEMCTMDCIDLPAWRQVHGARADWKITRQAIMRRVLLAKYGQHWDLATMLRNTGLEELVYLDPNPYWGKSKAGRGQNLLGLLTADVRNALRLRLEAAEPEEVKASA